MNNEKEKETFIEMVSKNTETTKGKEETIINNFIDTIYLDDKSKNELQ
jgi:nucleoid DNA-binding protein